MDRPKSEALKILLVDDDPAMVATLRRFLAMRGFDPHGRTDPREGLSLLEEDPEAFDVMVCDVSMPTMSGLEALGRAKAIQPGLPVIMLTADRSAQTATAALRAGAFNYITKPIAEMDEFIALLESAASYSSLHRRARELERKVTLADKFETLVGRTAEMRRLFGSIDRLSQTEVSVLIQGESGTGKELVARAIHDRSGRVKGPFVALNCGAIPETLIDSELFGHARGAFTGAIAARLGVFVEADGGTLFLDEIGEMPLGVQARLLRVLQEREVRPVGGEGVREVNVRVIAATHINLEQAVEDSRFRSDLYYRLNVVNLAVPPLRERADDIPLLVAHMLKKHWRDPDVPAPHLSPMALEALTNYAWPGNVRELENATLHALALVTDNEISVNSLPRRVAEAARQRGANGANQAAVQALSNDWQSASAPAPAGVSDPSSDSDAMEASLTAAWAAGGDDNLAWTDSLSLPEAKKFASDAFERRYILRALERSRGNIAEAARLAGVDRSNFRRVLSRLGIAADGFRDS